MIDSGPVSIRYYSGWPNVTLEFVNGPSWKMDDDGEGRGVSERRWRADVDRSLICEGFQFRCQDQYDRPSGEPHYKPLGSCIYIADGEVFQSAPPLRRTPSRRETVCIRAPLLDHTFKVHIVLPRDFDVQPERTYPVAFLNDGQNQLTNHGIRGGWHTDSTALWLARRGRVSDIVLAAIEMHPDRNRAFFPAGCDQSPNGQADDYTSFIAGPLLGLLSDKYRVQKGNPRSTAIAGSSNGAVHGVYAGLTRPDVFGLVGSFSYAWMTPHRNLSLLCEAPIVPFGKIWLSSGSVWNDGDADSTSDDNVCTTQTLRDVLIAKGARPGLDILYALDRGHAHNETTWRRQIGACLEFLFPPV